MLGSQGMRALSACDWAGHDPYWGLPLLLCYILGGHSHGQSWSMALASLGQVRASSDILGGKKDE